MSTASTNAQSTPAVAPVADHTWRNALIAASIAFFLCMLLGNRAGLSLEEYLTLMTSRLSWGAMIRERLSEGLSPLSYCYLRLFAGLGDAEWILRIGPALALGASVLAITRLAIALDLRRYLLPIWILSVAHPWWLMIGRQYQVAALLILTGALAGSSLVEHLKRPNAGTAIRCSLATGLLLWIHPSALSALAAFVAFVVWDWYCEPKRDRALLWQKLRPLIGGLLIGLPFFILLRGESLPTKDADSDGLIVVRRILEACFNSDSLWHETILGRWPSFPIDVSHVLLFFESLLVLIALGLPWKELGGQSSRACRFLFSLFLGIPLVQMLLFVVEPDFRMSVNSLAVSSIAFVILASIAWTANAPTRWRRIFRPLLVLVMIVQLTATCLYRGEFLRETAEWLAKRAGSIDSLLISTDDVNRFALKRAGYSSLETIESIERRNVDQKDVRERVRKIVRQNKQGVILLFATRAPIAESVESLHKRKTILDYRRWNVTSDIELIAWTKSASEKNWLRQLDPPILKGLMLVPESRR